MNTTQWRVGGWVALIIGALGLVVLLVLTIVRPDLAAAPLSARATTIFVGVGLGGLIAIAAVKVTERLEVAVADALRLDATQKDLNEASRGVVRTLHR